MLSVTIPYRCVQCRLTKSLGEIWTVVPKRSHPADTAVAKSERSSRFATCDSVLALSELVSNVRGEGGVIIAITSRVGRLLKRDIVTNITCATPCVAIGRRFPGLPLWS